MKALRIREPGGPEVLEIGDVPQPQPAGNELLVRVRAAGLNRADVLQRQGSYPPPPGVPADMPGLEFAGEVAAVGGDVQGFQPGDRVFGLVSGAAQAEYVLTHEAMAVRTPQRLTDIEAAAVPEAYITAHDALVTQAGLQRGERVLIHAIGSGVGIAALQIAKSLDCSVAGTSRSSVKLDRAKGLGLDVGIDSSVGGFADAVLAATDGHGIDVIIDFLGGPHFEENVMAAAPRGRIVLVSAMSGADARLPITAVMHKRLRIYGTVLRSRSLPEKIAATRSLERDVVPLLASGAIKVSIDKVFRLQEAAAAHRYLEENRNFGKIVFEID